MKFSTSVLATGFSLLSSLAFGLQDAPNKKGSNVDMLKDSKFLRGNGDKNDMKERKLDIVNWSQVGRTISGEERLDISGEAVSINDRGNIVAVGSRHNDGSGPIDHNVGHVRVYSFNGTDWAQMGQDIDGEYSHDYFGHTLQLSGEGNVIAVGAPEYDAVDPAMKDAGYVRILYYEDFSEAWVQKGDPIVGEGIGDKNGFSVALSFDGDIVAVGAPDNDNTNGDNVGYARVFEFVNGQWVQLGDDIDGEAAGDRSGYAVDLSDDGKIIAVGATLNDAHLGPDGYYTDMGHVRVWKWNGAAWLQFGGDVDGYYGEENKGYSVALSSDGFTLAVGAPNDCNSMGNVEVFTYSSTADKWIAKGDKLLGVNNEDRFGEAVSLSNDGNKLAVGSPNSEESDSALIDTGRVDVYEYDGVSETWNSLGDGTTGDSNGEFLGYSVALSGLGDALAIGIPYAFNTSEFRFQGELQLMATGTIDSVTSPVDSSPISLIPGGGAGGDPHFRTFSGEYFSYHGQCDLVLLQSLSFDSGKGLDVHIRTTRVDTMSFQYSYISGIALKIGNKVLEAHADGSLVSKDLTDDDSSDSEDEKQLRTFAGMSVTTGFSGLKKRIVVHTISLGHKKSIEIRANTKNGILFIDVKGAFAGSTGLLGSQKGLLARDGATDMTGFWNTHGEEWQVQSTEPKLFKDMHRAPQYPDGCLYEDTTKDHRHGRKLMSEEDAIAIESSAMEACKGVKGVLKDFCIADVVALGDVDLAEDPFYTQ